MAKHWMGVPPSKCDTCDTPLIDKFYDAATVMGPWAFMCPRCQAFGPGLNKTGTGRGQEYTKQPDGKFLKTCG